MKNNIYTPCSDHSEFFAIKTYFNLSSQKLKKVPYPTGSEDGPKMIQWTDEQRELAKAAKSVKSLKDLAQEVSKFI